MAITLARVKSDSSSKLQVTHKTPEPNHNHLKKTIPFFSKSSIASPIASKGTGKNPKQKINTIWR